MSKLLPGLDANKKPFQTYTIQHGIEHITILVPLKEVAVFESRFAALATKQKSTILALVESVGGKMKA